MRVIAIDGPAGSGKSTVARAVASRLHLDYLDTGAMYRAVTFAALTRGIDPGDVDAVADLAKGVELEVADRVLVDGVDATVEIRGPEVTKAVSTVAANPRVREEMVSRQRAWAAQHGGGVVEGRDIGTVVFPEAAVKVYLTASDSERASRRSKEMINLQYDEVAAESAAADIVRRDHADSTRAASPLATAKDAVVLDTTGVDVNSVIDKVLELAARRGSHARG